MTTNDATDAIDTKSAGDEAAATTESTDWRMVRLARVSEYEQQGVNETRPFATLLAAFQGDLFRTAMALEDAAHQALSRSQIPADCLEAAAHETAIYLRVACQITQLARLEIGTRMIAGRNANKPPLGPTHHPRQS
jgi:hypothetical protein